MPLSSDDRLLPISLVAHHVFCPRRAWLEAAGERVDSWQMEVGTASHAAVDDPSGSRPDRIRAAEVAEPELGIIGRCDAIERASDRRVTVVEHKASPVRRSPTVTEAMRIQLALQAMALESTGEIVAGARVYFTNHRTSVAVDIDPDLREAARAAVQATRRVVESKTAPPVLIDDPRCTACSHVGVCLPDERRMRPVGRRILASDPAGEVLHLATPGSRASLSSGRVVVNHRHETIASVPIERVAGVVVHGNIDLSSALVRELAWRSLTVVWCTGLGRLVGWSTSAGGPNGQARVRQQTMSAHGRLDLAREFVSAKIANQATLLRRNGSGDPPVETLRILQRRATTAPSIAALFATEGEAAALYFRSFDGMLKTRSSGGTRPTFRGRATRPARDPVNAALNYVYSLLVADVLRAIIVAGLDPHAGFLHSSNRNKPALALDLCEELRAPVADSVVIGVLNNRELVEADFSNVLGHARLRDDARRRLIEAYERRVQTAFQHPVFDYRVTWRRAMEVQARMLLGVIDGTQSRYVGIRVR